MAVLVAVCSLVEPRGYGIVDLQRRSLTAVARSVANLGHGLDTPVAEDVAWAVDNVPTGASVLAVDVGILGDIPGVRIVDMRGLTHRPAAEATARGESDAWLRSTLADPASRPAFLRLANWDGPEHPAYPDWMLAGSHLRADLLYGGGSIRWYATTDAAPSAVEREERWDEVLRRHPSHPFLRWHAALSAAADGSWERAQALARDGATKWPGMEELRDAPRSLSLVSATRALVWSADVGFLLPCGDAADTRTITPGERVAIEVGNVGGPPGVAVTVEDPCARESAPGTDPLALATCSTARQVRLTVRCESSGVVGVSLAQG